MAEIDADRLPVRRHPIDADHIEIIDIRDDAPGDRAVYSCVALYRRNWRDDWPALGGTRWLQAVGDESPLRRWKEAASLAMAFCRMAMFSRMKGSISSMLMGVASVTSTSRPT